MSLRSLARQGKTRHTYTTPKPRKPVEKSKPIDMTAFLDRAHKDNMAPSTARTDRAFGGCTKAERARKQEMRQTK